MPGKTAKHAAYVGIVVNQNLLRPGVHDGRKSRIETKSHGRAQRDRPRLDRSERRSRPVECSTASAHLAWAGEEKLGAGCSAVESVAKLFIVHRGSSAESGQCCDRRSPQRMSVGIGTTLRKSLLDHGRKRHDKRAPMCGVARSSRSQLRFPTDLFTSVFVWIGCFPTPLLECSQVFWRLDPTVTWILRRSARA